MAHIDLNTKIQNMLDELPEPLDGERRNPVLTKHDARWLANMALLIAEHQECHLGLNAAQIVALKETPAEDLRSMGQMVKERRRMLALVGGLILTILAFIGKQALAATDPEFWKHLFQKMFGL